MTESSIVRGLPAAAVFLTRLPIPGTYTNVDFANAAAFFPVVGAFVGVTSALVFSASSRLGLGDPVAACLAVGTSVLITGAMHEDGLADSADALFGGTTKERVLEIAKDPRIGSFGACALLLVLATRLACIATHPGRALAGFVLANTLSRLSATALMASLPYAGDLESSKSRSVLSTTPRLLSVAVAGSGIVLVLALFVRAVGPIAAIAAVTSAALVTAGIGAYVRARVGGILGDFLGATIQLVDLAVWLSLTAVDG